MAQKSMAKKIATAATAIKVPAMKIMSPPIPAKVVSAAVVKPGKSVKQGKMLKLK